jgi:transcription elongation factor GreA
MEGKVKLQLTSAGLASLKKELENLRKKRPALVSRLSRARAEGDLVENSDYINAKEDLRFLDGRIEELEDVLKNAKVIRYGRRDGKVSVGTKVTLKINRKKHVYTIVGDWEADPVEKKISHTSPLGKALMGKKVKERVEVEAPAGKVVYEVIKIE